MTTCETYPSGNEFWYKDRKLHKDNGPAVKYSDGSEFWYQNGNLHRDDGPAVEYATGDKMWCKSGRYHRTDGPAVEYADGDLEWWINDTKVSVVNFAANVLNKETALLWKMSGYCWPFDLGLNK